MKINIDHSLLKIEFLAFDVTDIDVILQSRGKDRISRSECITRCLYTDYDQWRMFKKSQQSDTDRSTSMNGYQEYGVNNYDNKSISIAR